jgi:hypothetical protein
MRRTNHVAAMTAAPTAVNLLGNSSQWGSDQDEQQLAVLEQTRG